MPEVLKQQYCVFRPAPRREVRRRAHVKLPNDDPISAFWSSSGNLHSPDDGNGDSRDLSDGETG